MGPLIRNFVLGILLVVTVAARVSAQAPAAPPPDAAKIPLSKIPRVHRAPKLDDFLENHPREAELTVTDFRQNSPGDGTPATESSTAYLSYDDKNLYAVLSATTKPARFARIFRNAKLPIRTTAWASSWTPTATFTARTIFSRIPWGSRPMRSTPRARDTTTASTHCGLTPGA